MIPLSRLSQSNVLANKIPQSAPLTDIAATVAPPCGRVRLGK